jgi:hypothetical protein
MEYLLQINGAQVEKKIETTETKFGSDPNLQLHHLEISQTWSL